MAPGRITITGFPDRASAAVAADIARRILHRWRAPSPGSMGSDQARVALTPDAHGFTCSVPDDLWHALLLELAQRLHAATQSIRYAEPETAA